MKHLSIALLFAFATGTALAQGEPQIIIKSDTVEIHFGVSSTSGAEVYGLRKDDLLIEDEGRIYPALDLSLLSEPGRYIFLVDTSESLEEEIRDVRDAVVALSKQLGERDRFSLISFDEYPSLRIANTSDRKELQREFEDLLTLYRGRRKSLTSVEQALRLAIQHAHTSKDQNQVIFLFSDGLSSAVDSDLAGLSELIERSGVIIHSIHFGGGLFAQASEAGFHRMQKWAELSGGRAFTSDRASSVAEIMKKLQPLVLRRYRLRYSPDVAFIRPGFHHVKIIHKDHADFHFSFVPFYFLGTCKGPEDKPCQASTAAAANSGVQLFPPPGMRMAPVRDPISDDFDFSRPGKNFSRLFARVGPEGIYNFYPEPLVSGTVKQASMLHLIQSRGIPNMSFAPPYTDYAQSFCVLGQEDSRPVQTPFVHWQRPFLSDEAFEVKLSPPEEFSGNWESIVRLTTQFVSMRFVQTRESALAQGELIVNCHFPLEYEVYPGGGASKTWKRPPDDPAAKTAFTWKSISSILDGLFVFEVAHFQ